MVLTRNALDKLRRTVVKIPLSTAAKPHPPITVQVTCQGRPAVAVIDQIRAVARHRLKSKVESMPAVDLVAVSKAGSIILEIR